MKYSDIHTLLFQRIREQRSWPDAGSSTKLAEQLQFIYAATVKIARDAKAADLSSLYKTSTLTLTAKPTGATGTDIKYYEVALPSDLFRNRQDLGIMYILIDKEVVATQVDLLNTGTFFRIIAKQNNYGNTIVGTDFAMAKLLLHGGSELDLTYLPVPVKPVATGGGGDNHYTELDFPLPSPFEEEVVAMVMMHIEAVITGNTGKSQISGLISKLYAEPEVGVKA